MKTLLRLILVSLILAILISTEADNKGFNTTDQDYIIPMPEIEVVPTPLDPKVFIPPVESKSKKHRHKRAEPTLDDLEIEDYLD